MSRTSFKISVEKLINFSQDNGDALGRDHLTSSAVDFEKCDIDFSTLKEKTINYLFNEMSDQGENKEKEIRKGKQ